MYTVQYTVRYTVDINNYRHGGGMTTYFIKLNRENITSIKAGGLSKNTFRAEIKKYPNKVKK